MVVRGKLSSIDLTFLLIFAILYLYIIREIKHKFAKQGDIDMLTEQDRKAIDACTTRPESVWVVIKEIAIKKYDEYLTALEPTCNTATRQSKFKEISDRWKTVKDNQAKKEEFLSSEEFDSDLCYVLKAVAQRLHGLSTKFINLKPYLDNWHNNCTIDRRTAFIISIGFGFNIEETQKLLYTVLDDDKQMDFNPRLPNEMIYAYAIINGIPMTAKPQKINGQELQQPSVENMLYEAKIQFLGLLFGNADFNHFPRLIEIADKSFNLLDSVNMTKAAFLLAAIKTSTDIESILKNSDDEVERTLSPEEDESAQNERRPKLLPDESVVQRCYEYVSYGQEEAPDEEVDDSLDFVKPKSSKSAAFSKNKYYRDIVNRPVFRNAQISQSSFLTVLNYVVSILKTAQNRIVLNCENDRDDAERRAALYSDMEKYIEKCVELVQKFPEEYLISSVDFLPLLGESNLGNYVKSDFTAMIDNIVISKIVDDWEKHRDDNKNRHVSSYHGINSQLTGDQVKYFQFFFDALKVAVRDLRAITARNCLELWLAYVEMNQILAYSYFSDDSVGMKAWEHVEDVTANCREYTYTVEKLQYNLEDAEYLSNPSEFITSLINDVHCLEYFNHTIFSRGKEKFVAGLEDEGRLISHNIDDQTGHTPLFLLRDDGTLTQDGLDDCLKNFYHYRKFSKQYYEKTKAFSRSDILKLAFWSFLSKKRRNKYNPRLGPTDFMKYFNNNVAPNTCCAAINKSNSIDRFLLLCLEHDDPVQFLKDAIAYQKAPPEKE